MSTKLQVLRIGGRSGTGPIWGIRFANPRPDENLPTRTLVCTRDPGHGPPHVAHCGDLPVAVAIEVPDDA